MMGRGCTTHVYQHVHLPQGYGLCSFGSSRELHATSPIDWSKSELKLGMGAQGYAHTGMHAIVCACLCVRARACCAKAVWALACADVCESAWEGRESSPRGHAGGEAWEGKGELSSRVCGRGGEGRFLRDRGCLIRLPVMTQSFQRTAYRREAAHHMAACHVALPALGTSPSPSVPEQSCLLIWLRWMTTRFWTSAPRPPQGVPRQPLPVTNTVFCNYCAFSLYV